MRRPAALFAAIALFVPLSTSAAGEMVVFWTITNVSDPGKRLPPALQVGRKLGARVSVEGLSTDKDPQDPKAATYLCGSPQAGIAIEVPDLEVSFASDPQAPAPLQVNVANDDPTLGDVISFTSTRNRRLANGEPVAFMGIAFEDSTAHVLSGDKFPGVPLDDRAWNSNQVLITGGTTDLPWRMEGHAEGVHCGSGEVALIFQDHPYGLVLERYLGQTTHMTVYSARGTNEEFEVYPAIASDVPFTDGIQGYSYSIYVEGDLVPTSIYLQGTINDHDSTWPGQLNEHGFQAFEIVNPVNPRTGEWQGHGIVGAEVFNQVERKTLPNRGTATILKLRVASAGPMGDVPLHGRVGWRDGLQGRGQPVDNILSINSTSVRPCVMSPINITVEPVYVIPFVRADTNGDGQQDLSDSVRIFEFLFLGTKKPICLSAADINSDQEIDLSDGIFLLQYLFTGGPKPREPFAKCGSAADAGEVSCEVSSCQ